MFTYIFNAARARASSRGIAMDHTAQTLRKELEDAHD